MTTPEHIKQAARFRKHIEAAHGIYYRMDKGISSGRQGTIDTLRWHIEAARAIEREAIPHDDHPIWALLDGNEKFAAKWNRIERRFYGARA